MIGLVFVTLICAPCPNPPCHVGDVPVVLPVPGDTDPLILAVKISPPVSTLSTNTVASLVGVVHLNLFLEPLLHHQLHNFHLGCRYYNR